MGESNDNFNAAYNRDYAVLDVTDCINNAVTTLTLNMPPEFNKEMRKQVVRAIFADSSIELLDRLLESIDNDSSSTEPLEGSSPSVVQPTRS